MAEGNESGILKKVKSLLSRKKNETTAVVRQTEPDVVDKVLGTPVSRRSLMGGTAMAAVRGPKVISEAAPIIVKQGIAEAAARLAPGIGWAMKTFGMIVPKQIAASPGRARRASIEEILKDPVPLDAMGRVDKDALWRIAELLGIQSMPPGVRLKELTDPEILGEAYRVQTPRPGRKADEFSDSHASLAREAVQILKRVTNVGENATVGDVQKVIREKVVQVAKNILSRPDRDDVLQEVEAILSNQATWQTEEGAELLKQVKTLREQRNAAIERTHAEKRHKQKEQSNEEIEKRSALLCTVERTGREDRDAEGARVFILHPKKGSGALAPELTRMHIQHLRQFLSREGVLDNFEPGTVQVESVGDSLRLSTTDAKFAEYLSSFIEKAGDEALKIPNRLQLPTDA